MDITLTWDLFLNAPSVITSVVKRLWYWSLKLEHHQDIFLSRELNKLEYHQDIFLSRKLNVQPANIHQLSQLPSMSLTFYGHSAVVKYTFKVTFFFKTKLEVHIFENQHYWKNKTRQAARKWRNIISLSFIANWWDKYIYYRQSRPSMLIYP